jgi:hypothetical protein
LTRAGAAGLGLLLACSHGAAPPESRDAALTWLQAPGERLADARAPSPSGAGAADGRLADGGVASGLGDGGVSSVLGDGVASAAQGRGPRALLDETSPAKAPDASTHERRAVGSHTLRVQALSGTVEGAHEGEPPHALAPGGVLTLPTTLTLARGARLTLALDEHVRLALRGPLVAQALPDHAPALLVREGTLTVEVAPRGKRLGAAFWLASPLARIDVAESARFFMRVAPRGGGVLALVSGHVQIAREAGALLLASVVARCITPAGLIDLNRPFGTLAEAEQTFGQGPSCAPNGGAPRDVRSQALGRALDAVQAGSGREAALLAEHERLVTLHDPGSRVLREQLARSAAVLSRQRRWAAALRAQREAGLLGRAPTDAQRSELARARALAPDEP